MAKPDLIARALGEKLGHLRELAQPTTVAYYAERAGVREADIDRLESDGEGTITTAAQYARALDHTLVVLIDGAPLDVALPTPAQDTALGIRQALQSFLPPKRRPVVHEDLRELITALKRQGHTIAFALEAAPGSAPAPTRHSSLERRPEQTQGVTIGQGRPQYYADQAIHAFKNPARAPGQRFVR